MITIEYGSRKFIIAVNDLLGAPTDCIVNPVNSGLSHGGGLAAQIADKTGPSFVRECDAIVEHIEQIPVTKAVPVNAGRPPYKGIINAVGPRMSAEGVPEKLHATITNCLRMAELKGWRSIGFPAINTGIFGVPKDILSSRMPYPATSKTTQTPASIPSGSA